MSDPDPLMALCLKLRREGHYWNAYVCEADGTPVCVIATMMLKFLDGNEQRQNLFKLLAKEAMGDLIAQRLGKQPDWQKWSGFVEGKDATNG